MARRSTDFERRTSSFGGDHSAPDVRVEGSEPVEFLMSLMAFASQSPKTVEMGPGWFQRIRSWCSVELIQALDSLGLANQLWSNLVSLLWEGHLLRETGQLIQRVHAADPRDLRLLLLSHHTSPAKDVMGSDAYNAATRGDAAQQRRMLRILRTRDESGDSSWLRAMLSLGVEETKALSLEVLRRWNAEVFERLRQKAASAIASDVERKRLMSLRMSPLELIFAATVGLDYEPQPGVHRVVLAPHIAMRPWNIVRRRSDVLIICYPISDESMSVGSPETPTQLARLYKALSDEKRLLILKMLSRSEASLDELAKEGGLAKSLVLYHLGVLRSAGLVRTGSDYSGSYRIRREQIPRAGPALRAFLRD